MKCFSVVAALLVAAFAVDAKAGTGAHVNVNVGHGYYGSNHAFFAPFFVQTYNYAPPVVVVPQPPVVVTPQPQLVLNDASAGCNYGGAQANLVPLSVNSGYGYGGGVGSAAIFFERRLIGGRVYFVPRHH